MVNPCSKRTDAELKYWWFHTNEEMFGEELFFVGCELERRGYRWFREQQVWVQQK